MVRVRVGLALLFVVLPPLLALAAPPSLSPGDLSRLNRGEIVFRTELPSGEDASTGNGGTAVALLEADVETVWKVLTDFAHYAGLFPRLTGSEVMRQEGPHALVQFRVSVGPFNFRFFVAHVVSWQERQIRWRLDRTQANDLFRDTWGYWRLEPTSGGRVLVTYAMGARTILPGFLTNGSERESVVKTVAALKAQVERARGVPANRPTLLAD